MQYEMTEALRKRVACAGASAFFAGDASVFDFSVLDRCLVFPGFADVHVHFREPGFSYKETIETGSRAAARGGYTDVGCMPNLKPVPDAPETLRPLLNAARASAIDVHAYGAISLGERGGELADMDALAGDVIGFSDDGRGVQSAELMRRAMLRANSLGKIIAAHCEDDALTNGGWIHDGEYARAHGERGIPSESEWRPLARDLELVRETGCAYHACHLSTRESVALMRSAKAQGLNVSCETAPHYLLLSDDQLRPDGRFKMNPPIRSRDDRQALIEGLIDGTIDMIATDHAPHSAEEKAGGLRDSRMGVVGLETAFPLMYTYLVKTGVLTLERLIELMSGAPRRRFGLPAGDDLCIWDPDAQYRVDPEEFLSKGKSTPFEGWTVCGRCLLTLHDGKIVWADEKIRRKQHV